MYDLRTTLLIVFLTYPGILLSIPAPGIYSWIRGLLQASSVVLMQSFSEGAKSTVASLVYWILFLIWGYIKVALALARAAS
jgi:predicted AlkP superfamily pyrophosphatase or phosphodiesterase